MSFVSDLSTKWRSWETASSADWSTALEREAVIRPLAEQLRLSQAIIENAAERLQLSRIALYRLLRRYRQRPQTSSLLPWTRGRHINSRHLNKDREDLITACIREFYLVRELAKLPVQSAAIPGLVAHQGPVAA